VEAGMSVRHSVPGDHAADSNHPNLTNTIYFSKEKPLK
jgi:hypothetical protein